MYPLSAPLIISSLLALSVDAAPQAPPPAPPAAPQAPPPVSSDVVHNPPDACGPRNQLSFDPQDSCSSPPPTVTSAASFGVLSSTDGTEHHRYDWATCNPVLDLICTQMFAPNSTTGMWNFATGPAQNAGGQPSAPCQMGFWIPNGDGAAGKPGTITSTNKPFDPTNPQGQCRKIFQTMLDVAASLNPQSLGSSINLLTNPGNAAGQFKLPGGSRTGSAFNAGYPSYVLAFDPDWSAPPPICTYPGTGAPCPCDRNQRCAPPAGSAAGADPFNCTDIANGQSCTCGSTITCGLTRNPQPQPQLLCHDSQTNQSCTCRSSLTCISSPPGPRPSCFIQASKAPCDCADMATNANCQKAN